MKRYLIPLLKTGWGIVFVIVGVLSLAVDVLSPFLKVETEDGHSIRIFDFGYAMPAWIGVVVISVFPAAIFRARRQRPLHGYFAFMWCGAALFTVMFLLALASSSPPKGGGLGLLAATVVAWRLLTWPDDRIFDRETAPKRTRLSPATAATPPAAQETRQP